MSAEEEVIVVFEMATRRAVRTVPSIVTIDDMANRKDTVSPFQEEVWAVLVAITDGGVEGPIYIMS